MLGFGKRNSIHTFQVWVSRKKYGEAWISSLFIWIKTIKLSCLRDTYYFLSFKDLRLIKDKINNCFLF